MLKLTKKIDYGLIALHYISACKADQNINAKRIAQIFDIPLEHLAKVLQKLAKQGLVRSQNGPKGGYTLGKDLNTITIGEVITAIEGPIEITHCLSGDSVCQQLENCTVRSPLMKIQESIIHFLNQTTLNQLQTISPTHPTLSLLT